MRRSLRLLPLLALFGATPQLDAQSVPRGFAQEFLGQFDASMSKFIALAEVMPADRYGWSPGEGVMTVAHVYAHVANYNFYYPATSLAVPAPGNVDPETIEQTTDKAQVIALLRQSGDHVREVVRNRSEADLQRTARLYGRDVAEWAVLLQLLAHMNEHLGQSIAYARMNGIVPPWSQ
jgi:uncharacterized damage-inducible protein DinB